MYLFRKKLWIVILPFFLVCCASESEKILDEVKNDSAQQIFEKGDAQYKDRSYTKSIDYFNALENLYPYGEYARRGLMELSQSYYYSNQKDLALSSLKTYIKVYPRSESIDDAIFLKAEINYNPTKSFFDKIITQSNSDVDTTNLMDALSDYSSIVEQYPASKYVVTSMDNIKRINEDLALSEIYRSSYYMSINANVAAINRANIVLEKYSDTMKKEEALAIIIAAYDNLNQQSVANNYRSELKSTFPNSKYISNTWIYKNSSWYSLWR